MTKTISLNEATKELPNIVEKLRSGDYVIVEKNGKPVAGIVDVDDMDDFAELQNKTIKNQIKKGYLEFKRGKARPASALLAELRRK